VRRVALIGGPIQILLTSALGTLIAARWLNMRLTEAIWFGAMISLSSTAIVLKMLSESGFTTTLASRVMIGLLVVQDLAVVPMLVVLPQLEDLSNIFGRLARSMIVAAGLLAAAALLGTWLLPKLLRRILEWGSRELFLISVVAIGIGVGYAAYFAGLSFALGAFVAGLVLSESEFSHQALSDVVPLRDVFGLLFFVSVGMLLDPAFIAANLAQIIAIVVLTILGKALVFGGIARAFGYVNMAPWIIGLGLSQIGEFTFVLARSGLSSGMISKPTYDLVLTSTVLTMALSPFAYRLALPLGRAWRRLMKPSTPARHFEIPDTLPHDHAIIAGYGRTGKAAVGGLRKAGIPVLVVELSHTLFQQLSSEGIQSVWGDATSDEILHVAGVSRARLLLLAVPDQNTLRLATIRARHLNPNLTIIARAVRPDHIQELCKLGVNAVIQPEFEGGVEMVRQALTRFKNDEATVSRVISDVRAEFYRSAEHARPRTATGTKDPA
ncbi:MAG TPA: cation:proton antiporter, partial [Bryobacteraceae bacterium]|nr:cation:proton antiporter [Bryobacteraceae bacterium]